MSLINIVMIQESWTADQLSTLRPSPYLLSQAGQAVQMKLWTETIEEMSKLTELPTEFSR